MLKVGDKAPVFTGVNQDGDIVKLENYLGKKVVLFFYPKANTPGCIAEACNLRDHQDNFSQANYQIIGVSADTVAKQHSFATKQLLPFPLIADENKSIINAYGVWGPKKFMGKEFDGIHRTTFVIDEQGFITEIINKVKTKEHSLQILK